MKLHFREIKKELRHALLFYTGAIYLGIFQMQSRAEITYYLRIQLYICPPTPVYITQR